MSGLGIFKVVDPASALAIEPWIAGDQLFPNPDDAKKYPQCRLGGGAFATVYRAQFGADTVAVKVVNEVPGVSSAQSLVRAEAAMMMRVACPQVISLFGVTGAKEDSDDAACLVMEYAKYGSLFGLLQQRAPLPWFRRIRILVDIAKGLVRCHQASPRVVHMDLKPHNVMICKGYRAKLSDFGCSKLNEFTRARAKALGSAAYMAPESRVPLQMPVPQWDIYGFGVLMWEVMTRQVPWTQLRSEADLDAALSRGERPSVQPTGTYCAAAVGAPLGYIELMNDCWTTKPSDRPIFMTEIKTATATPNATAVPSRDILPRLLVMLKATREHYRRDKAAAIAEQHTKEIAALQLAQQQQQQRATAATVQPSSTTTIATTTVAASPPTLAAVTTLAS